MEGHLFSNTYNRLESFKSLVLKFRLAFKQDMQSVFFSDNKAERRNNK